MGWDEEGWGGGVQFTSNLGSGWTGQHHAEEGFQVSKRGFKEQRDWQRGSTKENSKGSKKGNCAVTICCQCNLCTCIR
jgi:hypothetical protein